MSMLDQEVSIMCPLKKPHYVRTGGDKKKRREPKADTETEPGTENEMEILYSFMQPGGLGCLGSRFHVIITQRERGHVLK